MKKYKLFVKEASTALDRFKRITGAGYEYEGSAKKWLHRQIGKGKTPEQLGFTDIHKVPGLVEAIKKHSPAGTEVGFDLIKNENLPPGISIGVFSGMELPRFPSMKKQISRTFHTHPIKGMLDAPINKMIEKNIKELTAYLKSINPELHESHIEKNLRPGIESRYKDMYEKTLKATPIEAASPSSMDINIFMDIPKATHNIFNPERGLQGVHKIKPLKYGLFKPHEYRQRSIYRKTQPIDY